MSLLSSPVNDPAVMAAERRGLVRLYMQLCKARLSALVVLTTGVGFVLGSVLAMDWARLGLTVAGTALAAGGANALNQVFERHRDALMERTRNRPLPSQALGVSHAFVFGMTASYGGILVLGLTVNLLSAGLALLTVLLYVLVYTPLKTRTTTNTLVGAVCGAIPPMIGWAAATGRLDAGAWVLGALLFIWQIPHFFALAWLYRDDYARGGYKMLPVLDREGRLTGQVAVVTSLTLVPLALAATLFGMAGWIYALGALSLTLAFTGCAVWLYRTRSRPSARWLFLASILYLPLLLGLMVADRYVPVVG